MERNVLVYLKIFFFSYLMFLAGFFFYLVQHFKQKTDPFNWIFLVSLLYLNSKFLYSEESNSLAIVVLQFYILLPCKTV